MFSCPVEINCILGLGNVVFTLVKTCLLINLLIALAAGEPFDGEKKGVL